MAEPRRSRPPGRPSTPPPRASMPPPRASLPPPALGRSEREPVSRDGRLRAIALLLFPAFVGHTLQLLGEDTPWTDFAAARYWWTPGWHLALDPWVVVAIAGALGVAVLGLLFRRTRPWLIAVIALYAAHYLTYPFRIRNHMTLMLASLGVVGGCWLIARLLGAVDARGRDLPRADPPRHRKALLVDRVAVDGVAMVLIITYFFAGLHKTNRGFLTFGEDSAAFRGVTDFWIYGDLGHAAPEWAVAVAIYGTLVVEYAFPLLARLLPRLRVYFVIGLMLFHFPHVAVMNVADYPMLASAFYPALFGRAHWRLLSGYLRRPSAWNLGGAALGAGAQLWWIPYWGALTIFGIAVTMIWGFWAGSMLEMSWRRWRPRGRDEAAGGATRDEVARAAKEEGARE